MATPCTENSPTVALSVPGGTNLRADVILDPDGTNRIRARAGGLWLPNNIGLRRVVQFYDATPVVQPDDGTLHFPLNQDYTVHNDGGPEGDQYLMGHATCCFDPIQIVSAETGGLWHHGMNFGVTGTGVDSLDGDNYDSRYDDLPAATGGVSTGSSGTCQHAVQIFPGATASFNIQRSIQKMTAPTGNPYAVFSQGFSFTFVAYFV